MLKKTCADKVNRLNDQMYKVLDKLRGEIDVVLKERDLLVTQVESLSKQLKEAKRREPSGRFISNRETQMWGGC